MGRVLGGWQVGEAERFSISHFRFFIIHWWIQFWKWFGNDKWWIQLEVQLLKLVVKSKLR